jgi:hypothetical protein
MWSGVRLKILLNEFQLYLYYNFLYRTFSFSLGGIPKETGLLIPLAATVQNYNNYSAIENLKCLGLVYATLTIHNPLHEHLLHLPARSVQLLYLYWQQLDEVATCHSVLPSSL